MIANAIEYLWSLFRIALTRQISKFKATENGRSKRDNEVRSSELSIEIRITNQIVLASKN